MNSKLTQIVAATSCAAVVVVFCVVSCFTDRDFPTWEEMSTFKGILSFIQSAINFSVMAFVGGGIVFFAVSSWLEDIENGKSQVPPGTGNGGGPQTDDFIHCEVALLAKIAKADGRVDKDEIKFMSALFDEWGVPEGDRAELQRFFNEQKGIATDVSSWAEKAHAAALSLNSGNDADALESLLVLYRHLFLMALADGSVDSKEESLLRSIPAQLGFVDDLFDFVSKEMSDGGGSGGTSAMSLSEAYEVLGASPDSSDDEVRKAHKRQLLAFHPDKIQGKDLDPEWVKLANDQTRKINEAWDVVRKVRGL